MVQGINDCYQSQRVSIAALLLLTACHPKAPNPVAQAENVGYCERLQSHLDEAGQRAGIGARLVCLDLPGITALGRFGHSKTPEEGSLESCFDSSEQYAEIVERTPERFNLVIEESFHVNLAYQGKSRLAAVIPWMPSLELEGSQAQRLSVSISVRDAHFLTLVEVASRLQSQHNAARCVHALCRSDYHYVHKVLVGTPMAEISSRDQDGHAIDVGATISDAGWRSERRSDRTLAISSPAPVAVAIARTDFRTPYTDALCAECGGQDQACCVVGRPCDASLACHQDACVPSGAVGQPCDAGSCNSGAACVHDLCVAAGDVDQPCDQGGCRNGAKCVGGRCRDACGGSGQPCCAGKQCADPFSCKVSQAAEERVSSERVSLSGSLFGLSEDRLFGRASCTEDRVRTRFVPRRVSGDGSCERAWWFAPERDTDCRVGVHVAVPTFGDLECVVEVYAKQRSKELCAR